jgi:hypothetical protein
VLWAGRWLGKQLTECWLVYGLGTGVVWLGMPGMVPRASMWAIAWESGVWCSGGMELGMPGGLVQAWAVCSCRVG